MQINKSYKLEKAVSSPGDCREDMEQIHIEGDYAIATDGHVLAVVKLENTELKTDGYLSVESLQRARKMAGRGEDLAFINLGDTETHSDGAAFPRRKGKHPRWRSIIPHEEPIFSVSFNCKLLIKLAQAMNREVVTLEFISETEAIRVYGGGNEFGLLMPTRISPDYKEKFSEKHLIEQVPQKEESQTL